ncbi:hypothetical protein TNCV_222971 [Trichonephila clavipes]|nr:hypothetical protein TNCV_222971 [Trichonephila clavipes]
MPYNHTTWPLSNSCIIKNHRLGTGRTRNLGYRRPATNELRHSLLLCGIHSEPSIVTSISGFDGILSLSSDSSQSLSLNLHRSPNESKTTLIQPLTESSDNKLAISSGLKLFLRVVASRCLLCTKFENRVKFSLEADKQTLRNETLRHNFSISDSFPQ